MALTQVQPGMLASDSQYTGFKNRILNGQMVIDQRNAGASVSVQTTTGYTLDRWTTVVSQNSKFTVQQTPSATETGYATRVGAGFTNYLACTSSSAYTVGASEAFAVIQYIEGYNVADLAWGTSSAKTITLSFLAYSSLTGTFGGSIRNSANDRCYPFSYTISSANTWTQISITITGDTTGTWLTNNGKGIYLTFSLGAGSGQSGTAGSWGSTPYYSATGATSVVGTSGATFYITGVQLEQGRTATSFDYRPYGTELALCQRYYEKSYDIGTAPTTVTGSGCTYSTAASDSAGSLVINIPFATVKRAGPTITFYNSGTGASGTWLYARNGVAETSYSMNTLFVGTRAFSCYGNVGANYVAAYQYGHWTASSEL